MQLTKKQLAWLKKVKVDSHRFTLTGFHVAIFDGKPYIATTDGSRLHVTPAPGMSPGIYTLHGDQLVLSDSNFVPWSSIVPLTFHKEKPALRETLREIKERAIDVYGLKGIVVETSPKIVIEAFVLYDAKSYDRECTQRTQAKPHTPVRYDYKDGSFAVVMPLNY